MLRIEFVGDSITAGFKVSASLTSEPSTTANQDVHLAYPRHLADLFQTSGKSAVVSLYHMISCVRYEDPAIWILHLTFISHYLTAFEPHVLT